MTLIATAGFTHFTLDAVALAAGISKGGLLHHFPTKNDLLHGLAELSLQMWDERLARELAQEPDGTAGRYCRAYIRGTFDKEPDDVLMLTVLSRIQSQYPDVFFELENTFKHIDHDDGLPAGRALAIHLSCDGFWLSELAGVLLPEAQTLALRNELERLSRHE